MMSSNKLMSSHKLNTSLWKPSCCQAIWNTIAEVDIVSCLKQASGTQQDSHVINEVNIEGEKVKGRNPHNSLSPQINHQGRPVHGETHNYQLVMENTESFTNEVGQ